LWVAREEAWKRAEEVVRAGNLWTEQEDVHAKNLEFIDTIIAHPDF